MNLEFIKLIILCFFLIFSHLATAEMYKWIDENGKTQYSDKKPDDESMLEEIKGYISFYTPVDFPDFNYSSPSKEKQKRVAKNGEIVMFTITNCVYCNRAKEYFRLKKISYKELNIETSEKSKIIFNKAGGRGVPYTIIGKRLKEISISGFNENKFDKYFK